MRNLLTVLKKLGKKMTGQDIAGKNLVTVVDDIAEKYTGGSGGGEGGGGGDESNIFITTGTYGENIITLDKTFAEIKAAQEAGKIILYRDETLYTGDNPGMLMHTYGWTIWITSASDDPLGPYLVDIDNTKFFSSTADGELVYHDL